jgi:Raf kinase inhibitor-like YbhB/YbcL family protein
MAFRISSKSFGAGEVIPRQHTGEGADVSPALEWEEAPRGTAEFALICDDPDAPTPTPWVHWVLYKIPADRATLDEGDNAGAVEGKTSWGAPGYRGPMPPPGHGVHRYYFKLCALDQPLEIGPEASKEQLLDAIQGHVLAEAELIGTYERK